MSKFLHLAIYFLSIIGCIKETQDTLLPSGFYFIDDTKGVERILKDTQEHFFISPTAITSISTVASVKTDVIKTKVFKKTEKKYGLRFQLNDQGKKAMRIASKKAFETKQRIALIIDNNLVIAPYIHYEIIDGFFFIQIDLPKEEVKAIEKRIKTAMRIQN